jgi:hypothetical protein
MHSHPAGGLSIFSDEDIHDMFKLYDGGKIAYVEGFSYALTTASGTTYMLKITDVEAFQTAVSNYVNHPLFFGDVFDYAHVSKTNTEQMNEENFVKFLIVSKLGLTLLKGNINTFTNWQKLTVDQNSNIVTTPCN